MQTMYKSKKIVIAGLLTLLPQGAMNAVSPTRRPSVSNNPPPLEPDDIGAEVWM